MIYPVLFYYLFTGFLRRIPYTAGSACQYTCPETSCTFVAFSRNNIPACSVCLHLAPYRTQCSASETDYAVNTDPHGFCCFYDPAQYHHHALHDSPHEMLLAVCYRHAEKAGSRTGVKIRRTRALKMRQCDQSL